MSIPEQGGAYTPTPGTGAGATSVYAGAGVPVGGPAVSASAQLVARAAAGAGFRGTALVKAVAFALAESSGNPDAHCLNCFPGVREDSRGLWQINVDAHPQYANANLYDPAVNAAAAWDVSSGGTTFRPWSTYTSGKYLAYWPVAAAAAHTVEGGAPIMPPKIDAGPLADAAVAVDQAARNAAKVGDILGALTHPHTWYRVVLVVGGLAGMVVGVVLLDKSLLGGAGTGAVKAAGGGVVGSMAAKAAGV